VDPVAQSNRRAWEAASEKYVREHEDQLAQVARGELLLASELDLLRPLMQSAPAVVHLQSGNGLDDIGLVAAGARVVIGVDFSAVAARAARRRATELGVSCEYVVAEVPGVPLQDECADLRTGRIQGLHHGVQQGEHASCARQVAPLEAALNCALQVPQERRLVLRP